MCGSFPCDFLVHSYCAHPNIFRVVRLSFFRPSLFCTYGQCLSKSITILYCWLSDAIVGLFFRELATFPVACGCPSPETSQSPALPRVQAASVLLLRAHRAEVPNFVPWKERIAWSDFLVPKPNNKHIHSIFLHWFFKFFNYSSHWILVYISFKCGA